MQNFYANNRGADGQARRMVFVLCELEVKIGDSGWTPVIV
jgi:hypothetical protein